MATQESNVFRIPSSISEAETIIAELVEAIEQLRAGLADIDIREAVADSADESSRCTQERLYLTTTILVTKRRVFFLDQWVRDELVKAMRLPPDTRVTAEREFTGIYPQIADLDFRIQTIGSSGLGRVKFIAKREWLRGRCEFLREWLRTYVMEAKQKNLEVLQQAREIHEQQQQKKREARERRKENRQQRREHQEQVRKLQYQKAEECQQLVREIQALDVSLAGFSKKDDSPQRRALVQEKARKQMQLTILRQKKVKVKFELHQPSVSTNGGGAEKIDGDGAVAGGQ